MAIVKKGNVYYAGETIRLRLQGKGSIDLGAIDFVVLIGNSEYKTLKLKSECEKVEEGVYICSVSSEESLAMPEGTYDIEIKLSGDEVSIAVVHNALVIKRVLMSDEQ